jgi:3',5'-cyclic-AMP phosphodiesterase
MPIHLSPIRRREFLRRALLAGAGLGFAPQLMAAAARETNATSWALLADTHVAADAAQLNKGINMAEHLAAAGREILVLPERPAGVFVVGDCAFSKGEPGDYAQFSKLVEPLRAGGMPVHLALGNHDDRENFWQALTAEKAAKRPLADRQVAFLSAKWVNWFVLDSLEKTLQTPGALGEAQLKWLAAALDAHANKPAIVVVHHNPGLDGNFGLKDTAALLELMQARPQVKAWIYGHTHNWKVTQDPSGIHLVNLPPVSYIFREGDPAGWVHATLREDGMKLELRSLDTKNKAQGEIVDLKWRTA